jgi:hypothetical protein
LRERGPNHRHDRDNELSADGIRREGVVREDLLKAFVEDVRKILVAEPRKAALQRESRLADTPPPLAYTVKQMAIRFNPTLPLEEEQFRRQASLTLLTRVLTLFSEIIQGTETIRLLNDIADFPSGLVLSSEQTLSPEDRDRLRRVEEITISFGTAFTTQTDPNYDTDGDFSPDELVSKYRITVKFLDDNSQEGSKSWPPGRCNPKIRYRFRKAESRMVATLFHELLHIWYLHRYWFYHYQTKATGHRRYTDCPFFDEVAGAEGTTSRPFYVRLSNIFAAIDAKE